MRPRHGSCFLPGMAATNLDLIENRRSELQAAFLAFGSVSEQLSGHFESLRAQVAQLRAELGEAHAGKEHLAARLSALIKGLPGGVLVLDSGGEIQECNPVARELLGEPLLAQSFAAVLARAAVSSGGFAQHTELRNGRFVNISRRDLQSGGEVVLIADVTETHLMQVFLLRQQRLLTMGELAAGLAHQIRTPLAAALLYASQMTLPGRNAEDLSRCAERNVGSLKQLDKLVNDMLAFAQGGAAREVVSVRALLEEGGQGLRPRRAPGGRAQIVVSDNGPGVPAHIRERIFEPFFTTRALGNGIGLAIVRSVVEAHQGSVSLADGSSKEARGATFIIELPAEESA